MNNNLLPDLLAHTKSLIQQAHAQKNIHPPYRVVLGLSGGPDSIFLYHLLKMLSQEGFLVITAAHLNHGWRGLASDEDAQFCKNLAESDGISFVLEHAKNLEFSIKFNGSQEEAGRKLRRFFLERVRQASNSTCIMLAHHAQDQQETFFLRLMRGATLTGLSSMRPISDLYIRPLLQTNKASILHYLETNNLSYRKDATNESLAYLRNRIRKLIIPALQKCDSRFDKNFLNIIERLQEEDDFLHHLTLNTFNQIFHTQNQESLTGNLKTFLSAPIVLQRRILLHLFITHKIPFTPSNAFFNEILRFLHSSRGGIHHIAKGWKLHKKSSSFWLAPITI